MINYRITSYFKDGLIYESDFLSMLNCELGAVVLLP